MPDFVEKNKSWFQVILFLAAQGAFMIGSWQAIMSDLSAEMSDLKQEMREDLGSIRAELKKLARIEQIAEDTRQDLRDHKNTEGHPTLTREVGTLHERVSNNTRIIDRITDWGNQ